KRGPDALRMVWKQVDNRIDTLTLKYGGMMELRRDAGLVDVAMPGTEQDAPSIDSPTLIFSRRPNEGGVARSNSPPPATQPVGPPRTADQVAADLEAEIAARP